MKILLITAILTTLCTGCVGYSLDIPATVEVKSPLPGPSDQIDDDLAGPSRWACQSQSAGFSPPSKKDFQRIWGEPKEKIGSTEGGTWVYEESGRWCGLWLAAIIPIPLVLPVCETFDYVKFEGELAVSTYSRRFSRSTAGVVFHPSALFFPVPLLSRPGKVTENRADIRVFPKSEQDHTCGI